MSRSRGRGAEAEKMRQIEEKASDKAAQVRRKSIRTVLGIVIVLGGLAAAVVFSPPPPGVAFANLGNFHLSSLDEPHTPYNSSPPSSGPHFGSIAGWVIHEDPVPAELFVHNLEDGGVVLTYDCPDGCDEVTSGLTDTMAKFEGENVLMTGYAGIADETGTPRLGAAVVWNRVLYFDDWSSDTENEVAKFINLFEGQDNHATAGATN